MSFFVIPLWFVFTVALQVAGLSMLTAHLTAGVLALTVMSVIQQIRRAKLTTQDSNLDDRS